MLFKTKYRGAQRLFELWEFIGILARALESVFIVEEYLLEGYAMGMKNSHHYSIGEGGGATKLSLVMNYGADEKIAYPTIVSPNSLKKFVTGKGVGKKNEMLLAVYRKWGVDFGGQDDMADAYSLARVGAALLSGAEHAYENEVVNSLERNTEWAPKS